MNRAAQPLKTPTHIYKTDATATQRDEHVRAHTRKETQSAAMHANSVRKGVLIVLYAARVAILVGLVASGAFDPSYFTYLTFAFVTAVLTVGIVALWVPSLMIFYARWLFPLIMQQTLLVALLIVVIVQMNSDIFASHAIPYGGTMSLGELHTGDWVVHQYPAVDMLVSLLTLHHVVRFHVRSFWHTSPTWGRVLYTLYTLFVVMVPLAIYALVVPWQEKYPTNLNNALGWLIIVLLAGAIGGLYLLFTLSEHDLHYGWHRRCPHACPQCRLTERLPTYRHKHHQDQGPQLFKGTRHV